MLRKVFFLFSVIPSVSGNPSSILICHTQPPNILDLLGKDSKPFFRSCLCMRSVNKGICRIEHFQAIPQHAFVACRAGGVDSILEVLQNDAYISMAQPNYALRKQSLGDGSLAFLICLPLNS